MQGQSAVVHQTVQMAFQAAAEACIAVGNYCTAAAMADLFTNGCEGLLVLDVCAPSKLSVPPIAKMANGSGAVL